ncbi:MAG: FHA domain-containing protein [Planctomycetales bacterium]
MAQTAMKIVILRGPQQGEEFFLTKRITRLGSDGACEIRLEGEGIPGHAASIEFGADEIVVYNRTETALVVAGSNVPAQGSGVWKQGKDLLIGSAQLRLEAFTPKPVVAPKRYEFEEEEKVEPPDQKPGEAAKKTPAKKAAKSGKNNTGPIIFIAACLVMVVLMIIKKAGGDGVAAAVPGAQTMTWETVWTQLDDPKRVDSPDNDTIRSGLQHLYRLGNSKGSTDLPIWKSRVLQTLIAAETKAGEDKEFHAKLRAFVNQL